MLQARKFVKIAGLILEILLFFRKTRENIAWKIHKSQGE